MMHTSYPTFSPSLHKDNAAALKRRTLILPTTTLMKHGKKHVIHPLGFVALHHRLVTSWCLTVMRPLNVGDRALAAPPPRTASPESFVPLRSRLCMSRSEALAMDSERRFVLGAKTAGCIFSGDEHRLGCRFMGERLRGKATACTEDGSDRTQSSRRASCTVPAGPTTA